MSSQSSKIMLIASMLHATILSATICSADEQWNNSVSGNSPNSNAPAGNTPAGIGAPYNNAPSAIESPQSQPVQQWGQQSKQMKPLQGGIETQVVRPDWIPAYAYTAKDMFCVYHNGGWMWWEKKPIPRRPQSMLMGRNISVHWKGRLKNPPVITTYPIPELPEHFTFKSDYRGGPCGWLQYTGVNDKGFPCYRYWFDQPNGE